MASKYLILRANLTGMGGAHMYVRNKAIYEISKGYRVCVISSTIGNILIHDLKKYEECIIPEMALAPTSYRKKQRNNLIFKILKLIDFQEGVDDVLIESNDTVMALWGELLAERTSGKHFCFILNENFSSEEKWHDKFWEFKLRRHELAGIQEGILAKLFNKTNVLPQQISYYLPAFCSNVVDDCDNPILNKLDINSKRIGSIGRLNKDYVPVLCNELKIFAKNHPDEEWQFVFIGGSPNKKDENFIAKTFDNIPNVHVLISGYMFPIPRTLIKSIDVFASCAGSARVTYAERSITVSIDGDSGLAIGIMGYDTTRTLHAIDGDHPYPINKALEKALFGNIKVNYDSQEKISMNVFESKHDVFVEQSSSEKVYYPILKDKLSKRERIFKLLNILLDEKIVSYKIYPLLKRIVRVLNSRKA